MLEGVRGRRVFGWARRLGKHKAGELVDGKIRAVCGFILGGKSDRRGVGGGGTGGCQFLSRAVGRTVSFSIGLVQAKSARQGILQRAQAKSGSHAVGKEIADWRKGC